MLNLFTFIMFSDSHSVSQSVTGGVPFLILWRMRKAFSQEIFMKHTEYMYKLFKYLLQKQFLR